MKKFLEWFKNWKPIHLCWLFKKIGLPIPQYLIGGGSDFTLSGSRIANATRTWQSVEDAVVTDWIKSNDFIFAIAAESGAHSSAIGTLQIRWRNKTDEGSFALLSGSGELTWTADTDLVNGNAVVTGEKGCTSGLTTFVDGVEREGANDISTSLGNNEWTEHHWAIDCSNAHDGDEYEFELYDLTEGAAVGTCLATITMESAGVTVSPAPVSAISATLIGAIVLGSLALSPNPAVVIGERVNPTVIKGSLLLSPSPVEAVGAVIDPTVIISSEGELVTPDPVSAVGAVVDPGVKLSSMTVAPDPAIAIGTTINPIVIKGPLTIIPDPVSSVAAIIDPTIIKGSLSLNLGPVSSIGAVVDPVVIVSGGIIVSPSPTSAIGVATDPTVVVTVFIGDVPAPGIRLNMRASVIAHVPSIKLNIKGS